MFNHQIGSSPSHRSATGLEVPNNPSLAGEDVQLGARLRSSDEHREAQKATSTARGGMQSFTYII